MPSYLYYKRADEWVQVKADDFTQKAGSTLPGGHCRGTLYRVNLTVRGYNPDSEATYGPSVIGTAMWGPVVSATAEKIIYSDGNTVLGVLVVGHGYPGRYNGFDESYSAVLGVAYSSRVRASQDSTSGHFKTGLAGGSGLENVVLTVDDIDIYRFGGLPDDCAPSESCETKFYRNGQVIYTLDSCPEVTNGLGCSACCRELVAIAKRIQV